MNTVIFDRTGLIQKVRNMLITKPLDCYMHLFILAGIAQAGNMTVSDIVMFNVFYEIFTFCTSIVAEDPNGKLYHVRNLDFGVFMGLVSFRTA